MANEFEQISLQVSTFANGTWKENFLGIDFRQTNQNPRNNSNSWKLIKAFPKGQMSGKWLQTTEKFKEKMLKS